MDRIVLENVSKTFKIGFKRNQGALASAISFFSGRETKKCLCVLKNISFRANKGELIGIIGANGSGKSTFLRLIAGIYNNDSGKIRIKGNIISLIALASGLKERLTMKDNIYMIASLFGQSFKNIKKKYSLIVDFAQLSNYESTKLYQFSAGMKIRLIFSIAIHCDPHILILDEIFEVGDEKFRNKSTKKVLNLVEKGMTVLLVSHDMNLIRKYCSRVIWIDKGRIMKEGKTENTVRDYLKMIKNDF